MKFSVEMQAFISENRRMRQCVRKAQALAKCGFAIVPLMQQEKQPFLSGGSRHPLLGEQAVIDFFSHHPNCNYGVVTGRLSGVIVLDVDGPDGADALQALCQIHGPLPPTLTVETRRGHHYYFRIGEEVVRNSVGALGPGLDVRGEGGYAVGPSCRHPDGGHYRLPAGTSVSKTPIALVPEWLLTLMREPRSTNLKTRLGPRDGSGNSLLVEAAKVRGAREGSRNDQLNRSAYVLGQQLGHDPAALKHAHAELTSAAREAGLLGPEIAGTLASGFAAGAANPRTSRPSSEGSGDVLAESLSKLGDTDTDNATRFVARYKDRVAYAPGTGWLVYDDARWLSDSLGQRRHFAIVTAEKIADEAAYLEAGKAQSRRLELCERAKSAGAIERMMSVAQHQLAVNDAQFDNYPWLLNVRNGTIDLRTGALLPHNPENRLTRLVNLDYDPKARCPQFKKFLNTVTRDDRNFAEYLRRAVGYCLTGMTSEQVFFFVYGKGRNGKSTLVNLVRDMLGEYGCHTPTETLLVKQYDNAIPADLARLKGARMVTAAEANFNRQMDEAKIKTMTGGEPITARHLRQDYFSFNPEFKLWMMANDFPRVRGTADAFWRRVQALPFEAEIAEDDVDPDLPGKLRAELPGILAWAVRGTLAWRKEGLGTCAAVQAGVDRWKGFADHVARFLTDECLLDREANVGSTELLNRYRPWCERHGEKPLTAAGLRAKLPELDLTYARTRTGSVWRGLRLKD